MNRYYRITNPEAPIAVRGDGTDEVGVPKITAIEKAEFLAAVGDRPPDERADVEGVIKTASVEDAVRALAGQSRRHPPGAETVWSLNDETGKAKGWVVKSQPQG
jgi:hypothetical protein